ncbi:outer membrane protein assembly factor BamB family protein [Varunaivibrio sulfuroxidans]|uniref:Outer membrane protein assembly factor BamB n=1 Tax=Varunaivibrio sulfuroxidans TaxID=1773489 RepID=A0A4R3J5B0_9PROT|nr:PQQ-binding-like beta-propeller repeat protein [Varunaivibrio sulfuroxidans]TCS61008.1 outer membrane protein assembly factor BamB [Varunaivibrio sulfuroxidans]WES31586.1 PQQ-binding-like beta-propeller repeat protein [Varunaivibrio sulfuroxidans]
MTSERIDTPPPLTVAPFPRAKRRLGGLSALVLTMGALSLLGGCDTWFGTSSAPPLPGKRISVLTHQSTLTPDAQLKAKPILLPAPSPNPDWPQQGGYANHAMYHIQVNATLHEAWRVNIGAGASSSRRFVTSPIAAEGKVFAMDTETNVGAYDAKTGARLWRVSLTPKDESSSLISGGLAYDHGRVFVTTGFAQVIALDSATGKVLWRSPVDGPIHSGPTARGGRVFTVTLNNTLYALAASDGRTLWTHNAIAEGASLLGGGSPAVDQGVVVAPFTSGELLAFKVDNGLMVWADSLTSVQRTNAISTISQIKASPVIDRGRVFAIGNGDVMVAIDLRTGKRLWDKAIGGQQTIWTAGDYLYLITNNQELIAISRADGEIHWVRQLPEYTDPKTRLHPVIWTGPLLASNRLIVAGSKGQALAISPYTGKILGQVEMPSGVSVPPIIAGGSVYFLTDNAQLIAYR